MDRNQQFSDQKSRFIIMHNFMIDQLFVITRIRGLLRVTGITATFLAGKLGKRRNFLSDVANSNAKLSDNDLNVIADTLNTTVAYLKGETDIPHPTEQRKEEIVKYALFGTTDIDDAALDEVKAFAQYVKSKLDASKKPRSDK